MPGGWLGLSSRIERLHVKILESGGGKKTQRKRKRKYATRHNPKSTIPKKIFTFQNSTINAHLRGYHSKMIMTFSGQIF